MPFLHSDLARSLSSRRRLPDNWVGRAEAIALAIALGLAISQAVCGKEVAAGTGEIDFRPLPVAIVPAFPNLVWPDSLTGASDGQKRDVYPVILASRRDDAEAMLIGTLSGAIFRVPLGGQEGTPALFIDLRDRVRFDPKFNEEGLLGIALHPRFAENGEFFVYYTPRPDNRPGAPEHEAFVSRFRTKGNDRYLGDPSSEEILLRIDEPYWNHNGGTLAFGPDGLLYIAVGDGGASNDPDMNGQNLQTLLGKILRIDVDGRSGDLPYSIPADNPFANASKLARGEIWAYGFRNIWRLAFDRETKALWAADVGQDLWEEINIVHRGGNYGWNLREGRHPFGPGGVEADDRLVDPVWEYHHDVGKSITGGSVYRGKGVPELYGAYLYADYVSGQIFALWYDVEKGRVVANRTLRATGAPVVTFGEDAAGEIYFSTQGGEIFRFERE